MTDWTAVAQPLRPYRWQPHKGKRHAVPYWLTGGCKGRTACDEHVAVPNRAPTTVERLWPECQACDDKWRTEEGLSLRPDFARRGEMPSPPPKHRKRGN